MLLIITPAGDFNEAARCHTATTSPRLQAFVVGWSFNPAPFSGKISGYEEEHWQWTSGQRVAARPGQYFNIASNILSNQILISIFYLNKRCRHETLTILISQISHCESFITISLKIKDYGQYQNTVRGASYSFSSCRQGTSNLGSTAEMIILLYPPISYGVKLLCASVFSDIILWESRLR